MSEEEEVLLALSQAGWQSLFSSEEVLKKEMPRLKRAHAFYKELGGLAGYKERISSMPAEKKTPYTCHPPKTISLKICDEAVERYIQEGISAMPYLAELIALGGAADRLHLMDEETKEELPAALLVFGGSTLLSRLIRDLEAREYLYYQKFGEQIVTPIVIMTSEEKGNDRRVREILEKNRWFGRGAESFTFVLQPQVPVVNTQGEWQTNGQKEMLWKPGGHGVIWKLCAEEGVFASLQREGRYALLVRQINNPLAGLDYGLIAFSGIGWSQGYLFGFASTDRLPGMAEGMNAVVEKEGGSYLSNIEYVDPNRPSEEEMEGKEFPANTNILFARIGAIEEAVATLPFPGLLLNLKGGVGRLEATMQNIADAFIETNKTFSKTYITTNVRHKTISPAKKGWVEGGSLLETPEMSFYDLMRAMRELLAECGFSLPPDRPVEEAVDSGPSFAFLYHPALGPLYSMIRQKLQGGSLGLGSELLLLLSDIEWEKTEVCGSLQVIAELPLGHFVGDRLHFSDRRGKAIFKRVKIQNSGVDWNSSRPYWRGIYTHQESCEIILQGHSLFIAEDVTIEGDRRIEVPDGERWEMKKDGSIQKSLL